MNDEEWRVKFPSANHAPNPNCTKCGGRGWRIHSTTGVELPCICIYVSHDFADEAAKMIGDFAKRELKRRNAD